MSFKRVNGIRLHYQVIGTTGPWVALTPGGHQGLENLLNLAEQIAEHGYRVLLHDRRNCGYSEVRVEGEQSEQEIWADDLHALLDALGALPVICGGLSAGCRLSLLLALRYPASVRGLLLWWVTGGQTAATVLGHSYYGQYVELAERGGMEAVCASEHFAARILANDSNGDYLRSLSPTTFIDTMTRWQQYFLDSAELPVIGASAAALQTLAVPACIIPGNDPVHPQERGERLHDLLADSELHYLRTADEWRKVPARPPEDVQQETQQRLAATLNDFLQRRFPSVV